MSISPAHSATARVNGALSHGPATPEGKSISAQNATKHRLFSATALLSPEDQPAFDELESAFLLEYCPESPTEQRYIREMVDAEWRLQRARAHAAAIQQARMQNLNPTPSMDDAAEAFRLLNAEGSPLALLARYETQFRRQFDKSLEMLLDFRVRAYTDQDRIQRTLNDEQIRAIHALVNAPCPYVPPTPESNPEPPPQAQAATAAAGSPGPNPTNLQNEPSAPPFPQRRFINIFKKRAKNRPGNPSDHSQN